MALDSVIDALAASLSPFHKREEISIGHLYELLFESKHKSQNDRKFQNNYQNSANISA